MLGLLRPRLLLRLILSAAIGAQFRLVHSMFNGDIDEVRISSTNRSADWITAEYNNQNSPGHIHHNGKRVVPIGNAHSHSYRNTERYTYTYTDTDAHATFHSRRTTSIARMGDSV